MTATVRVIETFVSIQGETSFAGRPCAFIRLAGCNLACAWCDTRYASIEPGREVPVPELVNFVRTSGVRCASVTGGEPLLQSGTPELVAQLCEADVTVLVETNGSLDMDLIQPPARRIVDMKPPSSGMHEKMDMTNLRRLRTGDEVKFIIGDRADYEWSRALCTAHDLPSRAEVLFGAVTGRLALADLAAWILADRLDVRLQTQLHRIIWPTLDRGV